MSVDTDTTAVSDYGQWNTTSSLSAAVLSSVSPSSYPDDNSNHAMRLFGSNFASGDTLTFLDPSDTPYFNPAELTYVSSSEIDYQSNDGSDPGTWTVQVDSPSGNSNTLSFTVASPSSNVPPTITAPSSVAVQQGQPSAISGVSIADSDAVSADETITATLADASGLLSVTTTQGSVSGSGTKDMTISGSLSQVNADLGTLTDLDSSSASDNIVINANDGRGGTAPQQTIAVPVPSLPVPAVPDASIAQPATGTAEAAFTFQFSSMLSSPVSFRFHTVDGAGTAVPGEDYFSTSDGGGTIYQTDPGRTTDTVQAVKILGESGPEPDQTVIVQFDDLVGAAFSNSATFLDATLTITNNNPPPPDTTKPSIIADNPLSVHVGGTGAITASLLDATDPDNTAAQLTYTVTSGPADGTLLVNGSAQTPFTQADINAGWSPVRKTAPARPPTNSCSTSQIRPEIRRAVRFRPRSTTRRPSGHRPISMAPVSPTFCGRMRAVRLTSG